MRSCFTTCLVSSTEETTIRLNHEVGKHVRDKAYLSLSILHVKLQAVRRQSDPKIPLSNANQDRQRSTRHLSSQFPEAASEYYIIGLNNPLFLHLHNIIAASKRGHELTARVRRAQSRISRK